MVVFIQDEQDEILPIIYKANEIIFDINNNLKQLSSLIDAQKGHIKRLGLIETTKAKLSNQARNLLSQENIYNIRISVVEEKLASKLSKKDKKTLKKELKDLTETLKDIREWKLRTIKQLTSLTTLKAEEKKDYSVPIVNSVKKLTQHISSYRAVRKELIKENACTLTEIALDDFISRNQDGTLNLLKNKITSITTHHITHCNISSTVMENGIEYIEEVI